MFHAGRDTSHRDFLELNFSAFFYGWMDESYHRFEDVIRWTAIGIGSLNDTHLHVFAQLCFVQFLSKEESVQDRESVAVEHVETTIFVQKEIDQPIGITINWTIFRIFGERKTIRCFLIQFHVISSTLQWSENCVSIDTCMLTYILIQMTFGTVIEDLQWKKRGKSLTQMRQLCCTNAVRCVYGHRIRTLSTGCDLSHILEWITMMHRSLFPYVK